MNRCLWPRLGSLFVGMGAAGVAACSSVGMQPSASSALPNAGHSTAALRETASGLLLRPPGPYTSATPPFNPGETLTYAWNRSDTLTRWSGPTAAPSPGPTNTATGTFIDKFSVDKKTGIYTEITKDTTSAGGKAKQSTLFGFVASGSLITQVDYSSKIAEALNGGTLKYSALTTYPQGATAFVYPATSGSSWSGAAASIASYSETQSGSGGYSANGSSTNGADGSYKGQDQLANYGSYGGYAEQYDFAFGSPATYVLSLPGLGVNPETWKFAAVKNEHIPVTASGTAPLPFPTGRTQVPDWYPGGGALPDPAYVDNYTVAGTVAMPSACGTLSGEEATDVKEAYWDLDPILGIYETNAMDYYLDSTDTTVCMVEVLQQTMYSNGNAWESLGAWGGPWSQLNYNAAWVLTSKTATGAFARELNAMPVVPHVIDAFGRNGIPARRLLKRRQL
jgi:hypothetical protein